jgi:hypothetical protein
MVRKKRKNARQLIEDARNSIEGVPFQELDGTLGHFKPEDCQRFNVGPPEGPYAPSWCPEAPDWIVDGRPGRYFAWTHWGGDPGVTARSAACSTKEDAFRSLAEAIRAVRKLMIEHGQQSED